MCIDDSTTWPIKYVQKGQIYTVHEISEITGVNGFGFLETHICVRLTEVMFCPSSGTRLWGKVTNFRPVQTVRDETMEALRAHLDTPANALIEDLIKEDA